LTTNGFRRVAVVGQITPLVLIALAACCASSTLVVQIGVCVRVRAWQLGCFSSSVGHSRHGCSASIRTTETRSLD